MLLREHEVEDMFANRYKNLSIKPGMSSNTASLDCLRSSRALQISEQRYVVKKHSEDRMGVFRCI
jgi:hypothetical protein